MSVTAPWHECRYVVVVTVKHSKYLTTMENTLKATIKKKEAVFNWLFNGNPALGTNEASLCV